MLLKPLKSNAKANFEACHIRMARTGLNLTVRELAMLSKVNKATIVRIEGGDSVRSSTMETIIEALEKQGAKFHVCSETNEIFVGLTPITMN